MKISHSPITDKTQNWWQLFCIQMAGGIISLPLISAGQQILLLNGVVSAILCVLVGNFIILVISYSIVSMSIKHRLNAIENAQQVIGKTWGRVLAFFILAAMIGWLARQLSTGIEKLDLYPFLVNFSIGPLIGTAAALALLGGVRGLKFICVTATVLLFALLCILMIFIIPHTDYKELPTETSLSLSGVSVVLASLIASIVDYPTFFRHSKTKKDAVTAIIAIFFATISIQIAGVLLFKTLTLNTTNIPELISSNNFISITLVLFLIISMIGSAAWNMYAASVGWESLFPQFKDKTEYALIGMVAIALFTNSQLENFVISSTAFGDIVISGMGGLLVFIFLNQHRAEIKTSNKNSKYHILSWIFGACFGLASYFLITNYKEISTVISFVSAFMLAAIITQSRKIYRRFVNR